MEWRDFKDNPDAVLREFRSAFSRAEADEKNQYNFSAVYSGKPNSLFEIKDVKQKTKIPGDEALTTLVRDNKETWLETIQRKNIGIKKVIFVTSPSGTEMVVPGRGHKRDIFQYFQDDEIPKEEKEKFLLMIFKKVKEVSEKEGSARIWTDGSDIPWLHVRVTPLTK